MKNNIVTLFEVKKNSKGVYCVPAELMEECLIVHPMQDSMRNKGTVLYAYNRKATEKRNECFIIDTLGDNDLKVIIDYISTGEKDFRIRDLGIHGNTHVLDYKSIIVKFITIKDEVLDSKLNTFASDVKEDQEDEEDCTDCELKEFCPNYNIDKDRSMNDKDDEEDDYEEDYEDEEEDCTDCPFKNICPGYDPKKDRSLNSDEEDCGYRGDGMNDPDNFKSSNKQENNIRIEMEDLPKSLVDLLKPFLIELEDVLEEDDYVDEEKIDAEIKDVTKKIDDLISDARTIKSELKHAKELKKTGFRFVDYEKLNEYIYSNASAQENIEARIKELKSTLNELKKEKAEQQKQYRNENHIGYTRRKSILDLFFGKDLY